MQCDSKIFGKDEEQTRLLKTDKNNISASFVVIENEPSV